ncbi:hypothetical protein F2Q69_00045931 [Brassica cretica]|uniref:Uncharacterized protein n=1 Tax=Brassica cretica TaxID=69181 RepID=A0A8S9PQC2_BRACR|nr:hypothetical protein F2Q69_00045931 [Brassica cretica]
MEEDTNAILSKMNAPKAPAAKNANTRQEPRQHAPSDKNGRKDGYMYVVNENNMPVSTLVVRGEEGYSSADEEKPANRRRIEVILSQQTLSSDDENDDTPVLEDLRDVLKRKFESEDNNNSKHNDLRTTLDARKSQRISTSDLREKLNAGACDLRIRLNRSKSTELRRRLEQTKTSNKDTPSSKNDNSVSTDLRAFLDSNRVKTRQQLNVIMGGSPPYGNSVRSLDSSDKPVNAVCATQPTTAAGSAAGPSRTVDLTKHCKYHDVKGHDTTEFKSLYAHYLSSLASGDFKGAQRKATGKGRQSETQQRDDEEDTLRGNGEGDSSADEEQPANRRRIEVILSQQTLSSDDKNDDTPVLEDLRDVLKRKFEPEDSNSSKHNDPRTTLEARKSRGISTGDLRDKLNAGACDLRICLNRSKSTDLRRRLEETKTSSNDSPS